MAAIKVVNPETDDVILVSADGIIIRILASTIRVCARPSKGVTVMRIKEGNKLVAAACVPHDESEGAEKLEAEAINPEEEAADLAEDIVEEEETPADDTEE